MIGGSISHGLRKKNALGSRSCGEPETSSGTRAREVYLTIHASLTASASSMAPATTRKTQMHQPMRSERRRKTMRRIHMGTPYFFVLFWKERGKKVEVKG